MPPLRLGVSLQPRWSIADDLGQLAVAGLSICTLWLPIAAEHMEQAMEWIAAEVMPQLTPQPAP